MEGTKEYPCPVCRDGFWTEDDRYDHAVGVHSEAHARQVCAFINGREILISKTSSHSNDYKCPSCRVSGTLGEIAMHCVDQHAGIDSLSEFSSSVRKSGSYQSFTTGTKRKYESVSPPASSSSAPSLLGSSPLAYRPAKKARALLPAPDVSITPIESIIKDHPNPAFFFAFVASRLSNFVNNCVFESVMQERSNTKHQFTWDCDTAQEHGCVDEVKEWRDTLVFHPYTACFKCFCPQYEVFAQHPQRSPCVRDSRNQWKAWMMGLPFLIYRTRALRVAVFGSMGMPEDSFPTLADYAGWIVRNAIPGEKQATNLLLVIYLYFILQSRGELKMPKGGYMIDSAPGSDDALEASSSEDAMDTTGTKESDDTLHSPV